MLSSIRDSLAPRHFGLAGLCLLAYVFIALFHYDRYGIEESAALDLLLNWSIVHQIASPVAFYGVPDLRAILFVPLDLHWVGSLIAAKVYTMFFLFGTALMLYRWAESRYGSEAAMIAAALMLISPICLLQTDSIGSGVYLLWSIAVAHQLDRLILASERTAPSWLFLQVLICALAVSLHPMGVAVPLALMWRWYRERQESAKAKRMLISLLLVTALMLFLRWGWYGIEPAAVNPLRILSDALLSSSLLHLSDSWGIGLIIANLGLFAALGSLLAERLEIDRTALMLILASAIGALHADHAWVLIYWTMTLYLGVPLLIKLNEQIGWRGVVGQRGLVLLLSMLIVVVATNTAKNSYRLRGIQLKSDTDMVIAVLEQAAEKAGNGPFLAASQWPARTLLVTRRDVLPLPPAMDDVAMFRKKIAGITHMAFNPKQEDQHQLARNMAALSHEYVTVALLPGGVVVEHQQGGAKQLSPHTKP